MARHQLSLAPELAAIAGFLDWVGECCAADGLPPEAGFRMTLALEEAVTNVMRYAFDGCPLPHRLEVRLDIAAARLVAEVTDNGRPFDPLAQSPPDLSLPIHVREAGGLGIHLIRWMTDRAEYRHEGGLNRLYLETRLPSAGQGR